jgi:hypothetical protein
MLSSRLVIYLSAVSGKVVEPCVVAQAENLINILLKNRHSTKEREF